jgi:hypothetical protein
MSELMGIARFKFHEGKVGDFKRLSARAMRSSGECFTGTRDQEVVEMGESRTPRPEPFASSHYERVRSFSSTPGPRIGTLP